MAKYIDALRGYAHPVHCRDDFVCVYCGLDGKVWPNWLYLSWDHLLPRGHTHRDDHEYIVTACIFCNTLHNRTVFVVEDDGRLKTRDELVDQKRSRVLARRHEYRAFWEQHVQPQLSTSRS